MVCLPSKKAPAAAAFAGVRITPTARARNSSMDQLAALAAALFPRRDRRRMKKRGNRRKSSRGLPGLWGFFCVGEEKGTGRVRGCEPRQKKWFPPALPV